MIQGLRCSFLVVLMVVSLSTSSAQKVRKLEVTWLAKDFRAVELIPNLLLADHQTLETIRATLGENTSVEEEDLGFGARRVGFSKANGYTLLSVNLFTLNQTIEDYNITVRGNSDTWPQIRSYIIDAWTKNGGPEFKESASGLSYRRPVDPEFAAYKKAVALELGEMRAAMAPAALKDDYEYLISPRENSVVGYGGCGYGGMTPAGKQAIDALMKAHRIDLVENVLKGYNPGGRVYAAIALLEMGKQGLPLSDEARTTIEKIKGLDIKIETCSGCIGFHRTAKEILESPE
jgi:hypothetical protein